jgi:transcriptional regulator with XRE-family HTH domain
MNTPLRQVRERRNLTIQQVAAAVGIDSGNLSRIERGIQVPSKDLTEKLSQYFDNEVTETQIIYPERFAVEANVAPGQ